MSAGGLVCGFWDEASGLAGLGWDLGGAAGGLLLREGEAATVPATIGAEGETVTLKLEASGDPVEAVLTPDRGPAALEGDATGGGAEAAACTATVSNGDRTVTCRGQLTRWGGDPLASAGTLRHMALPAADGALLVVLSRAEAGAESHSEESGSAWLLDPEGRAGSYPHAFLSTQYDDGGHQTRAGLELWSADTELPPIRAAGTVLGRPVGAAGGVNAAIMRTAAEGSEGIGSYLIWRG